MALLRPNKDRTMRKYYCKDCGTQIHRTTHYRGGRCHRCANKIICQNNRKPKKYCLDCRKQIPRQNKRCKKCYLKILKNCKGKENFNFKNGKSYNNKCQVCGKRIYYGFTYCKKHAQLKLWSDPKHRAKILRLQREGMKVTPNKKEQELRKLLNKLFTNEYKFVGDGKIWIDRYNPDFINVNGQKKIIELYGDYWHNKSSVKYRDKYRNQTYKKYGYETLIIWEKELGNKQKLMKRLKEFQISPKPKRNKDNN